MSAEAGNITATRTSPCPQTGVAQLQDTAAIRVYHKSGYRSLAFCVLIAYHTSRAILMLVKLCSPGRSDTRCVLLFGVDCHFERYRHRGGLLRIGPMSCNVASPDCCTNQHRGYRYRMRSCTKSPYSRFITANSNNGSCWVLADERVLIG